MRRNRHVISNFAAASQTNFLTDSVTNSLLRNASLLLSHLCIPPSFYVQLCQLAEKIDIKPGRESGEGGTGWSLALIKVCGAPAGTSM